MRVLVPTEQFPNLIQPWLLTTLEQIERRGGEVWVVSGKLNRDPYQAKVDELGLSRRTLTLELGRVGDLVRTGAALLTPGRRGRFTRRGFAALAARGTLLGGGLRSTANRFIKSPAYGLPRPDLVHSHALVQGFEYLEVARHFDVPMIHTFHGLHLGRIADIDEDKRLAFYRDIDACLVNTAFARDQVVGRGCPEDKIHVIPQGVVLEEFPFRPTRPEPGRPLRLLTVARLDIDKGHRYAIEAVRILGERGIAVEYRIVGGGPDEDTLPGVPATLGVQDRVTFLGRVDDETLRAEYARADVFVLPSIRSDGSFHEETQGVAIQEAQASGAIVVTTRTGGIPECVGDSALLVGDRDPGAIADAVQEIAAHPERWSEWQRRGRARVEERFDADRVGAQVWEVYREAVRRHRRP